MKPTTVAAIDLGATSGRVIVGRFSSDGFELTETHRFPNGFRTLGKNAYWEVGSLYEEVRAGLRKAVELFPETRSCGVDTWAVDYALVDESGRLVFPVHSYRDTRTEPILREIEETGMARQLYDWTGLPVISFNTGVQFMETLRAYPQLAEMARRALFLPDYFNYLLSGEMVNEFSVASSSQLLDVQGDDYAPGAMEYFQVPAHWLQKPERAGRVLGPVRGIDGVRDLRVSLVPGHDTSCAFEAIPGTDRDMIVSSGTWILMGARTPHALTGEDAFTLGISNERCGDAGYRPCKNLMGLWLLEQLLPQFRERPQSDAEWSALITAAEQATPPKECLDTSDRSLFNPPNMKEAIDAQLQARSLPVPTSLPEYTRLICDSLARSMADTAERYSKIAGISYERMVMVGGGSKNRLLCQRTADFTGMPVVSYSLEGTAVGNMAYQLLALGAVDSLHDCREIIRRGINEKIYQP